MEILLKYLDDIDDLLAVLRLQFRPLFTTVLLFIAFGFAVGAVYFLGPPELLAAP